MKRNAYTGRFAKSKMRNVPTVVDGHRFASKKEAKRYGELKLLEKTGEIQELTPQHRYKLEVNGEHICYYIADFLYFYKNDWVTEDVKGRKSGPAWELFRIKAKLMKACHDIEVTVI